jgi:hypothetical protein
VNRHEQRRRRESPATNSTYKKLAVQWLNEALCFASSLVVADSFVLRNRQLLVAAKRYWLMRDEFDFGWTFTPFAAQQVAGDFWTSEI